MYENNFAQRLATLRVQKGISAREMSLAIGQNASYINRIENRKALPSMQGFFYICEYLNISPKDFFDFDAKAPDTLNSLIIELRKLSTTQLETISTLIKEINSR